MLKKILLSSSLAFLAGLLGGLLGGFLAGPTLAVADNKTALVAGELRLADANGRTRLLLTLVKDTPRLFMLDDAGEYRLEMGLGEGGEPHIWLRDKDGAAKVQVALTQKGRPAFRLADQKGRDRAIFALSDQGEPTLLMRDQSGKDRLALWHGAKEGGLALANAQAQPVAAFSVPEAKKGRLSFFDKKGKAYQVFE